MPLYLYQGLKTQAVFELAHSMHESSLAIHPETGEPLKRLYTSPHVASQHSAKAIQNSLSDKNLAEKGFTKYEKVKTGHYQRTLGNQGPSDLRV